MIVLVTGAAGQVGADLVPELVRRGVEVVAADRTALDITDEGEVHDAVGAHRPEVIVNLAAMTDVDRCESDPDLAMAVNGDGVRHLAGAAERFGARLVTLSTDYVFDGTKIGPYVETDLPAPQSVYGRSKLAGERAAGPEATVVRTAWLSGRVGRNMVKTVLRLLDGDGELRFVDDQRGSPTMTADLALAVADAAVDHRPGVFHVVNGGETTWYGLAREIAVLVGADPERVRPITTAELQPPRPAPRPANSVLDGVAWRAAGGRTLRPYGEALAELVASLR